MRPDTPGDPEDWPTPEGVTVEQVDDRAVVHVRGEVDIATSPALDDVVEQTLARGARQVVIDLADVTFMGSSGLASLLRAHRRAAEEGSEVLLRRPSRAVSDVLDMTRLRERFQYDPPD